MEFLTEATCIFGTSTHNISSSSKNIKNTACVSRLSFRFLWLWLFFYSLSYLCRRSSLIFLVGEKHKITSKKDTLCEDTGLFINLRPPINIKSTGFKKRLSSNSISFKIVIFFFAELYICITTFKYFEMSFSCDKFSHLTFTTVWSRHEFAYLRRTTI